MPKTNSLNDAIRAEVWEYEGLRHGDRFHIPTSSNCGDDSNFIVVDIVLTEDGRAGRHICKDHNILVREPDGKD